MDSGLRYFLTTPGCNWTGSTGTPKQDLEHCCKRPSNCCKARYLRASHVLLSRYQGVPTCSHIWKVPSLCPPDSYFFEWFIWAHALEVRIAVSQKSRFFGCFHHLLWLSAVSAGFSVVWSVVINQIQPASKKMQFPVLEGAFQGVVSESLTTRLHNSGNYIYKE